MIDLNGTTLIFTQKSITLMYKMHVNVECELQIEENSPSEVKAMMYLFRT